MALVFLVVIWLIILIKDIETDSAIAMLGIGLACLAISLLQQEQRMLVGARQLLKAPNIRAVCSVL